MFRKREPKEKVAIAEAEPASPEAVLRGDLGLHQLWYLELRLRDEVARSARTGIVFSIVTWQFQLLPGEKAGEPLMRKAAWLINRSLRPYDVAARVDSERFVALLLDADYQNASTVAYRVKGELQIGARAIGRWKAGVASFLQDGLDEDSIIQAAIHRLAEDSKR